MTIEERIDKLIEQLSETDLPIALPLAYVAFCFLLGCERTRKKEIRLEALALLDEFSSELIANCGNSDVSDELHDFVYRQRKELEGT